MSSKSSQLLDSKLAGASVRTTAITNADAQANVTNLASQARATIGAIQERPTIVTSVSAVNSAAKATASAPTLSRVAPGTSLEEDGMNSPESPSWGFLQWAVAGLASIGASVAAFVWRLMARLHALEIAARQHQHDLDVSQSANESALLRLAERQALQSLAVRFDRAFDPRVS